MPIPVAGSGYCFGIRSERRLCEEVHLNLAYRWFCQLGLEDVVPDHCTFSMNRTAYSLGETFRMSVDGSAALLAEAWSGEGFAVDASATKPTRPCSRLPGQQASTGVIRARHALSAQLRRR